MKKSKG